MLTLGEVFWLFLLGFGGWYWWKAKAIKEIALRAAKAHCQRMDVALLDDAALLRGIWFKRDPAGRIRIWRRFLFEFSSTGQYRYQGCVVLLGQRVESVQLEPHQHPMF